MLKDGNFEARLAAAGRQRGASRRGSGSFVAFSESQNECPDSSTEGRMSLLSCPNHFCQAHQNLNFR